MIRLMTNDMTNDYNMSNMRRKILLITIRTNDIMPNVHLLCQTNTTSTTRIIYTTNNFIVVINACSVMKD